MKKENNAGYSLIEVLAAILLLGILSVPLCNSLVMGHKMNVKSQTLLQAQLEVSAAVEQLMAEGITGDEEFETYISELASKRNVRIDVNGLDTKQPYYTVTVTSKTDPNVSVSTTIRSAAPDPTETSADPGEGGEGGDAT